MDSDTTWHHIDTQRLAVADLLERLDDEQWTVPSLCSEWTVRDVAAHLAWQDVRVGQVLWPILRAGFDSNAMIRDQAVRSPLSPAEVVAKIRSFTGRRVKPPFVSEVEPLTDVLVHTQDICLPLGLAHDPPVDALAVAIGRTVQLNEGRLRLRPPLRGVRLVATDADWQLGEGSRVVAGTMKFLLLAVAGRTAAHEHLSGDLAALA